MSYFLRHPVDNFPYWPPDFTQRPYTIVGIQIEHKLEDLILNQIPQHGKTDVPILGVPRPATFAAVQAQPDLPRNLEYRGTYGPSLYDYFWQTQGYRPNPAQRPGSKA